MFTPRGYTALPQDASQDENDEFSAVEDNDNIVKRNFEKRRNAFRHTKTMSVSHVSLDNDENTKRNAMDVEGGSREKRAKRNVRFASRSQDDKPDGISNMRRLCFVLSLMISTLTIFVFAFTLPCKGPSCNVVNMIETVTNTLDTIHNNWTVSYRRRYSTGIISHVSPSKTREVVVSFMEKKPEENRDQNFQKFQQSGLISLQENNGKLLWMYNASDVLKLIECRTDKVLQTCLIQSSYGRLQLINSRENKIIWSTRILIGSLLPSIIIGINDCDGDKGRDVLLSYDRYNTTCQSNQTLCTHPGIVQLISGRTGYPIGSKLNIPQSHLIKRVSVHSSKLSENLVFVLLVGNKGHLKIISIQELYHKILNNRNGESLHLFNKASTVSVSDVVSTDHEPVVKDLNKDFVQDIILVTLTGSRHSLTAVDGGKLKKMWRISFGSRKMLSQPVIGHFNKDEVPDILVVLQDPPASKVNQSLVQILDGQNGVILWSRRFRLVKDTTPFSASIGYKSDVFYLWIEKESRRTYPKMFLSRNSEIRKQGDSSGIWNQSHQVEAAFRDNFKNSSKNIPQHRNENISHHNNENISHHSRKRRHSSQGNETESSDSLIDEIFIESASNKMFRRMHKKHDSVLTETPELAKKKEANTHKILEDILKGETVQRGSSIRDDKNVHRNTTSVLSLLKDSHLKQSGEHQLINRGKNKANVTKLSRKTVIINSSGHVENTVETGRMANRPKIDFKSKLDSNNSNFSTHFQESANMSSKNPASIDHHNISHESMKRNSSGRNDILKEILVNHSDVENVNGHFSNKTIESLRSSEGEVKESRKYGGQHLSGNVVGEDLTGKQSLDIMHKNSNSSLFVSAIPGRVLAPNSIAHSAQKDVEQNTSAEFNITMNTEENNTDFNMQNNTRKSAGDSIVTIPLPTRLFTKQEHAKIKTNHHLEAGMSIVPKDVHKNQETRLNERDRKNRTKQLAALRLLMVRQQKQVKRNKEEVQQKLNHENQPTKRKKKQDIFQHPHNKQQHWKYDGNHGIKSGKSSSSGTLFEKNIESLETAEHFGFSCSEGLDLALIAIVPNSEKNSFSIIAEEKGIKKKGRPQENEELCDTLWPTLNSSPLVRDVDSDGFMEIIYAVNYGDGEQNREMKVRKFSIKMNVDD